MNRTALVIGAGGFIGHNLVKRLKSEGWYVVGVDLKYPQFEQTSADEFLIMDASQTQVCREYDRIYQLAADMGGAGFIFSGDNDADVMTNSASININILRSLAEHKFKGKVFYSSSVCVYSKETTQEKRDESSAYPANPDSKYGWEKLFSEQLYQSYAKNYGIDVRIARFNNTYGPYSTFEGGREKSPAAVCRKVLENKIVIWGDGKQIREFVYIDDLLDAIEIIMNSGIQTPINIGPDDNITIDGLVRILTDQPIIHTEGPIGLQVRLTGNELIKSLGWSPKVGIEEGLKKTFQWIQDQRSA